MSSNGAKNATPEPPSVIASSTPCEAVARNRKSQTAARRPVPARDRERPRATTTAASAAAKTTRVRESRGGPSTWPQGMPNDRPMTSRSGAIAQARAGQPEPQRRAGPPEGRAERQRRRRRARTPSASAATIAGPGTGRADSCSSGPVTMRSPAAVRKRVGVVVGERRAPRSRPAPRPRTTVPASTSAPAASVGPSVPSVPGRQHGQRLARRELQRRGQRELLAAPAAATAPRTVTVVSPAGDQAAGRRQRARPGEQVARDLARLALRARASARGGAIAQRARPRRPGRIDDERVVADDQIAHALEGAVARLGRLGDLARAPRAQARPGPRPASARRRRGARARRARRRSASGSGAVGPDAMTSSGSPMTSESASVSTVAGQAARASSPPLKRERCLRTAFSSLIGRAGGQQQPRHRLLVLERDRRRRRGRERGAAAGDEDDDEVVGRGRLGQRQEPGGGGQAAGVGHRMAGLGDLDPRRRQPVAVLDDHEPLARRDRRGSPPRARAIDAPALPAPSTSTRRRPPSSTRALAGARARRRRRRRWRAQQRGDVTGGERRAPDGARPPRAG